jgi:hypothetical protein
MRHLATNASADGEHPTLSAGCTACMAHRVPGEALHRLTMRPPTLSRLSGVGPVSRSDGEAAGVKTHRQLSPRPREAGRNSGQRWRSAPSAEVAKHRYFPASARHRESAGLSPQVSQRKTSDAFVSTPGRIPAGNGPAILGLAVKPVQPPQPRPRLPPAAQRRHP